MEEEYRRMEEKQAVEEEFYRQWLLAHTMVDTEETLQECVLVVDDATDYKVDIVLDASDLYHIRHTFSVSLVILSA